MENSRIKWVSPTGKTVMHQHDDGTVSYIFPSEPHPQLPHQDNSNKPAFGFKNMVDTAKEAS